MSSFEELLRQAEAAQKERDQSTQALKDKKIKEDAEKRRRLMDQFKRAKPAVPVKKVVDRVVAAPSRPSTSASVNRRSTTTASTANRPSSKPSTSKVPKPRSSPANPKQTATAKSPSTVKPRNTQPSFAEMMKLAQNNVTQGVSPLDRPKPTPAASLPSSSRTPLNDQHRLSAQKRKLPQMPSKTTAISRPIAMTDRSSKQVPSSLAQHRPSRMVPSKSDRPDQPTRSQPSQYTASKRPRYYDDEDGYDSLDDFIDDDEVDFEAERELKSVVQKLCRSDEITWKQREREIDLRRMENTFHGVQMEESRSERLARMEDKAEEERGVKLL